MPYTRSWDETAPLGSAQANTVDDIVRNLKVDLRQRLNVIFTDFTTDPVVANANISDAGTNTVISALTLTRVTSGTAAAGLGGRLLLQLEDASGNTDAAGAADWLWTTATHGSEAADFVVRLMAAGAAHAERFRITSAGVAQISGTSLVFQSGGVTGTLVWAPAASNKTITLPNGTTDFTATGGASQVLRQSSAGAAITVATLASTELSDTTNVAYIDAANVFSSATGQSMKKLLLPGSTSGTLTVLAAAVAGTNTLTLPAGTTDFSATGGASQVLQQASAGAAITVGQLAASNLSNGTSGTGAVVLVTSPSLTTPSLGVASATSLATSAATPLLLTNGQLVSIALTSQTVGATTLTIPNFASVSDTFVFTTLAQTLSNKTFVAPALGTPASGVATNLTGTAAGLTAGNVTTNANLTGPITSTGNATAVTDPFPAAQITFTKDLKSTTAIATPSAFVATQADVFASTVSGAAIMGFGTTNDVALMNRAGTVVLGVGPNTTTVNAVGNLTVGGTLTGMTNVSGTGNFALVNSPTFVTPVLGAATGTSLALGADPADAGVLRLENAAVIGWEAAPAGTDGTLTFNASEIFQFSHAVTSAAGITATTGTFTGLLTTSANLTTTGTGAITAANGLTVTAGSFIASASGPHAIGGATASAVQLSLLGTFAERRGLYITTTLQPAANADSALVDIEGTIAEAGSGTHAQFAALLVNPPAITPGVAALTSAASLRISAAPTGATNNYAFWVDAGVSRFDGNVGIGTTSPDRLLHAESSTALTATVSYAARLSHITSGTPANSIGVGLEFEQETSADNNEVIAILQSVVTDVTATAENAKLSFLTMQAGAAAAERGYFGLGLVVGSPTDGDKGAGTINAVSVYDDGVILTDHVFDALRGPIDVNSYMERLRPWVAQFNPEWLNQDVYEQYWQIEGRLPTMADSLGQHSVGQQINGLTLNLELQAVHMSTLLARIAVLEKQVKRNGK